MCDLYQIITRPRKVNHKNERRLWVELGVPMTIGHQLAITTFIDRPESVNGADQLEVRFRLQAPGMDFDVMIGSNMSLDMSSWIGLIVTPLCIWRQSEKIHKVSLQIVRTNDDIRWGDSAL